MLPEKICYPREVHVFWKTDDSQSTMMKSCLGLLNFREFLIFAGGFIFLLLYIIYQFLFQAFIERAGIFLFFM